MSKLVHVIHSCASNSFSGLEQYVLDLVMWQHARGHTVELYCREGSELCRRAEAAKVRTWKIGPHDRPGPRLWWRTLKEWKLKLATIGRPPVAGDEIVLHLHAGGEPWYHLPWILYRRRWGGRLKKVILHFHLWINHKKKDPLHWLIYSTLDEIWTSSESAKSHLEALLPVKPRQIRIVPYGRDLVKLKAEHLAADARREIRARFKVKDDDLLAVCVSRIEPIKGIEELFTGFVRVAHEFSRVHLVIIGDASPHDASAAELMRALRERQARLLPDIRERLHLPGYLSEATRVMAAADLYIIPSYEECMSLALLDALILGLPVLGTSSGGTPSVVKDGQTGWLVRPADVDAMAEALRRVFSSPPRTYREFGENARLLGQKFERTAIFEGIWEQYQQPCSVLASGANQ